MSKERELLREIMCYIASGVVSITSNDLGDAAETLHEIQELLAQPEQPEFKYSPPKVCPNKMRNGSCTLPDPLCGYPYCEK